MDLHLKELFTRFQEQFSSGPSLGPTSGTCLLKVDGIPTAFIKSLFRAAAALYRTEPWKRLRPHHLFGLRIGKDFDWSGKKQPFPCAQFIGGDGGDLGFHMFKSDLDAQKMTGLSETSAASDVELLRVVFIHESLLLPSTKRMIRSLSLDVETGDKFPIIDVARRTSTGNRFRNPTAEELRYVFAFMKAITIVHPFLQFADSGKLGKRRLMKFESFIETVDVQWPPELPRAGELVAVTISHPPVQIFQEKKLNSENSIQAAKSMEQEEEEIS
ncbi:uncharacterized protein LOC110036188 [Phalaenopsis equestris]|uniref:uncharacterized protein LOC110036188 n=1 Tax=Phalaenopsis equestris TaxID=78828 RepID=UPI0009E4290F|nr:uncharacterized protein LOC110036188 [Phalaenopsis equestris]